MDDDRDEWRVQCRVDEWLKMNPIKRFFVFFEYGYALSVPWDDLKDTDWHSLFDGLIDIGWLLLKTGVLILSILFYPVAAAFYYLYTLPQLRKLQKEIDHVRELDRKQKGIAPLESARTELAAMTSEEVIARNEALGIKLE